MSWEIRQGHVLDRLREIPDDSVNCVVTSPPYWGLRNYGTDPQQWGGDECEKHHFVTKPAANGIVASAMQGDTLSGESATRAPVLSSRCDRCGLWIGELGSEPTIGLFIEHMVSVFSELRRVLRPDGTCWLNIGDSYAGSGKGDSKSGGPGKQTTNVGSLGGIPFLGRGEIAAKSLCLIPERLALALQDAGWYVRSRIAWCKTSAMPESVRDRPTSAWEHIWLLTKSSKYWYDADAVREPLAASSVARLQQDIGGQEGSWRANGGGKTNGAMLAVATKNELSQLRTRSQLNANWDAAEAAGEILGANQRNYWVLGPDPYSDAHFATFPREIPRRAILAGCPIGGTVLEPFAGSGTTLFVAEELGRNSIGIELNPEYIKLAEKRMDGARTPLPGFVS